MVLPLGGFADAVAGLIAGGVAAAPLAGQVTRIVPARQFRIMVGIVISSIAAHQGLRLPWGAQGAGLDRLAPLAYVAQVPPGGRPMATNPVEFINQARAEIGKVVWPSRREVVLTTVMVLALSALAAVFFSLVDLAIRSGLTALLSVFGS